VPPGTPPPPSRSTKPGKQTASVQAGDGNGLDENDAIFDEAPVSVDAFHVEPYGHDAASPEPDSGYEEGDEDEDMAALAVSLVRQAKKRFIPIDLDASALAGLFVEGTEVAGTPCQTLPTPGLDHRTMSDSDTALDTPTEHPIGALPLLGKQAPSRAIVLVTEPGEGAPWTVTPATSIA